MTPIGISGQQNRARVFTDDRLHLSDLFLRITYAEREVHGVGVDDQQSAASTMMKSLVGHHTTFP